jgi:hypothetical protein
MLIIVLFFATTIAVIIAGLAGLAFTSTTTQKVYSDKGKLVNALDSGLQAAIENTRLPPRAHPTDPQPPPACATDPVTLSGVNAINGYDIEVTCLPAGPATDSPITFNAHPLCGPSEVNPPATAITATATLTTIGGPHGPPIARIATWKVGPRTPCPTTPTP